MVVGRIGERQIESELRVDATKQAFEGMLNQFEAVLLQSTCKSNCIDEHFARESNPIVPPRVNKIPVVFKLDVAPTETDPVTPLPEIKRAQPNQPIVEFVKSIWPFATEASHALGLDPGVLIAQAALETGWGQFIVKDTEGNNSNNLFNIKSVGSEPSVKIKTTEYLTNTPVKMMASFKKYSSVADSFKDYISLLKGTRYKDALASTHDPEQYVHALHQAGYATDPDYASKVLSIYHGDELQRALEQSRCRAV